MVSWVGTPCSKGMNFLNHSSPYSSIASHPSAPLNTAQMASRIMFTNLQQFPL
jgi:hypothetical protein